MIVHLFHESLLWSMVIFVRICEIFGMSNKYLFSPDMIGGTLYYACDYMYHDLKKVKACVM